MATMRKRAKGNRKLFGYWLPTENQAAVMLSIQTIN